MTKGRPFSIYCIILFLCTEARKNNHILLQRGMYLSQKWSTAPFCPPVHRAARPYGLCVLYDTAARVSEICSLCIEDVRFENPPHIRIMGKGMKVRAVPILPATAQNLKKYLTEMHMLAPEKSHLPLFMNRNGQKLTRAGVMYILNKYAKAASVIDPSVPEKIPPHLMRHTKAMHIYDADNDLVHVRDFLGHSDIKTTDIYARSSLTMKQKALERVSDSPVPSMPSWQKSRSTMEWLKSFGSQKA